MSDSPDAIIRRAARYISADPELATQMLESSLSQTQDVQHLREIGKMARKRIRELRKNRPRRQPRWSTYSFRDLLDKVSGAVITFYRDVTRSSTEKNGIYRLTIAPPAGNGYAPVVTLTQPDGSSLVHGRQASSATATEVPYGRRQIVNGRPIIYLNRLSWMMQASLIGSKEAVASFFNLGSPEDWTQERTRDHLTYGQAWVPSQKVSTYDDGFLRRLPLFASLRAALPASMSDPDVLGTVREALVREQEAFKAAEAARLAAAGGATAAASPVADVEDVEDDVEDEFDPLP